MNSEYQISVDFIATMSEQKLYLYLWNLSLQLKKLLYHCLKKVLDCFSLLYGKKRQVMMYLFQVYMAKALLVRLDFLVQSHKKRQFS